MGTSEHESVGQPPLVVASDEPNTWIITSSPIPLMRVELFFHGGFWFYRDLTSILAPAVMVPKARKLNSEKRREDYYHEALQLAASLVTNVARYRWKEHFTPVQRILMGQQQCPFIKKGARCTEKPSIGSVWCPRHRFGKAIR